MDQEEEPAQPSKVSRSSAAQTSVQVVAATKLKGKGKKAPYSCRICGKFSFHQKAGHLKFLASAKAFSTSDAFRDWVCQAMCYKHGMSTTTFNALVNPPPLSNAYVEGVTDYTPFMQCPGRYFAWLMIHRNALIVQRSLTVEAVFEWAVKLHNNTWESTEEVPLIALPTPMPQMNIPTGKADIQPAPSLQNTVASAHVQAVNVNTVNGSTRQPRSGKKKLHRAFSWHTPMDHIIKHASNLPPKEEAVKKGIDIEVYDDPLYLMCFYFMVIELNRCYELYVEQYHNENSSFPDNPQHLCTSGTTKSHQSSDTDGSNDDCFTTGSMPPD